MNYNLVIDEFHPLCMKSIHDDVDDNDGDAG
jgi:DNA primase large subunit